MRRQGLLLASQFVSLDSEQARNFYIYEMLRSFARLSELRDGKSGITVLLQELPPTPASDEAERGVAEQGNEDDDDDEEEVVEGRAGERGHDVGRAFRSFRSYGV